MYRRFDFRPIACKFFVNCKEFWVSAKGRCGLISVVIPLLLLVNGCSPKTVSRSTHDNMLQEQEVAKELKPEVIGKLAKVDTAKAAEKLDKIAKAISQKPTDAYKAEAVATLKTIIAENEGYVFNPEIAGTPTIKRDQNVQIYLRKILFNFNRALLLWQTIAPNTSDLTTVLKKYEAQLFYRCQEDSLEQCAHLDFFSLDAAQLQNLLLTLAGIIDQDLAKESVKDQSCQSADCRKLLVRYYNLLFITIEKGNERSNLDLEYYYLKYAGQYKSYLLDNNKSQDKHQFLYNTFFSNYQNAPPEKRQRLIDLACLQKTWLFSKQAGGNFTKTDEVWFTLAAQRCAKADEIVKAIDTLQQVPDSFHSTWSKLVTNHLPVLEILKIPTTQSFYASNKNIYFYLVDRLFGNHIEKDQALALWQGSPQESDKLLSIATWYLDIYMLNMLIGTNEFMSSQYNRDDLHGENLFNAVINSSADRSTKWDSWLPNVERVRSFLRLLFANKNNHKYEAFEKKVGSLATSTKYLAVYPNMMVMTYFLYRLQKSSIPLYDIFGGQLKIDSTTSIQMLFSGSWNPWFRFASDSTPLTKTSIAMSFYYALATGLFDTYSNTSTMDPLNRVSKTEFFSKVVSAFLDDSKRQLVDNLKALRHIEQRIRDTQTICDNFDTYVPEIPLESLPLYTYGGSRDKGPLSIEADFFSSKFVAGLELANTKFLSQLRYVDIFVEILEQYIVTLRKITKNQAYVQQEEAVLGQIKKIVDDTRNIRQMYIDKVFGLYAKISPCVTKIRDKENEMQMALLAKERHYLEEVHNYMAQLQSGQISKDTAGKELALNGYLSDWDDISPQNYRYSIYGLMLRLTSYLAGNEKEKRQANVIMPTELNRIGYINNRNSKILPWQNDKNSFIAQGLRFFNGESDAIIYWFSDHGTRNNNTIYNRWRMLVELFKARDLSQMPMFKKYCSDTKSCNEVALINEILTLVRLVSIQDNEVDILKAVGKFSKGNPMLLQEFLFKKDSGNIMPIFDYTIEHVVKDYISGYTTLLQEAQEVAETFYKRENFWYDIPQDVCRIIRDKYKEYVISLEKRVKDFIAVLKELEESRNGLPEKIIFEFDNKFNPKGIDFTDRNAPVIASATRFNEANGLFTEFHKTHRVSLLLSIIGEE